MSLAPQPPLPAPPILTPPAGWLGHLGIKSGGSQPGQVAGFLTPTMEMDYFYRAGGRSVLLPLTSLANAGVNGTTGPFGSVPQGHVWLIENIQISTNALGAAANIYGQILVTDPAGNAVFASPQPPLRGLTGEILLYTLPGPMIALPGYGIFVECIGAAAPTAFNWFCRVIGQDVLA